MKIIARIVETYGGKDIATVAQRITRLDADAQRINEKVTLWISRLGFESFTRRYVLALPPRDGGSKPSL